MNEVSETDANFVKDELAFLSNYLRAKYPKLDIPKWFRETLTVSV